jgi:hypothetical protein
MFYSKKVGLLSAKMGCTPCLLRVESLSWALEDFSRRSLHKLFLTERRSASLVPRENGRGEKVERSILPKSSL